jgi:hypothetical protein
MHEHDESLEGGDDEAAAEAGEAGVESPPQEILELSASCVGYVRAAVGVGLDFTPETLPLLDHYLVTARQEVLVKPDLLPLLSRVVGAYFGEVVRGMIGGFWEIPPNVHDWRLCARPVFLWFNPVGIAYDALLRGAEHDGPRSHLRVAPEDRIAVEQRLAAVPPVPEDEFYLLSTRLEAIEVAVELLHARMVESGYGETEFDLSDYGGELHPIG